MRLQIGIDDTDSPKGGCTTYIAALLVEKFSRSRMRFTDYPNIIRLNPNIPYKTRGNAAVALRLEIPTADYDGVREISIQTVEDNSEIGHHATDPAVVFLQGAPSSAVKTFSRKALTEIVSVREAARTLKSSFGSAASYGSGLGLVGALAAVGDTLEGDYTYELLAYRCRQNLSKPRRMDEDSIVKMDRLTSPRTFSSYDAKNKRVLIKPHGPDPVLLGLRGETPEAVRAGFRLLQIQEPVERWVIFRTNHGTEAHFQGARPTLRSNYPVVMHGIVNGWPNRIHGGHVFLDLRTSRGVIQCAAFEPTGKLKEVVAKLIPGDRVTIFGGIRRHVVERRPLLTVNLEKLIINRLNEMVAVNPKCPHCDRRMKSAGRGQGFKCPRCGHSSTRASKRALRRSRSLRVGIYIPDKKAHRHLTKPYSRYGLEKSKWDGNPPTGMWHRP